MHERKARMAELSDAFVALPGGLGTLEEVVEALTWTMLGIHLKPVGLLNVGGYYDLLEGFLDGARDAGVPEARAPRARAERRRPRDARRASHPVGAGARLAVDAGGDPARRLMTTRVPAQQVRVARREDFPAMARVLARAFHEDPLTVWLYPRERSRDRHVERSFMVSLNRLGRQNQLYTTDDHAGGALWALPGAVARGPAPVRLEPLARCLRCSRACCGRCAR